MKNLNCYDIGSEVCPCVLAKSGNCVVCTKNNGGSCSQCNWHGICITTLLHQNSSHLAIRSECKVKILQKKKYTDKFTVLILSVSRGFAQKATTPGAYIFARANSSIKAFDMPISILKSEPEFCRIHIGVCNSGPKSQEICNAEDSLIIRGVFRGGLCGLKEAAEYENCVVYAKGIAIAPLNNLRGNIRGIEKCYVDLAKINEDFFYEYFGWLHSERTLIVDFSNAEELFAKETVQNMKNAIVLASPFYVELFRRNFSGEIVYPATGNYCCGEGICGACTCQDEWGETIHKCKYAE